MKRGKILLIDDNEKDLQVTKELLEKVGYTVIQNYGWLGTTNSIKFSEPDMVLLDVKMPAITGDQLYDIINKHLKERNIPVLFYSSLDESELRKLKISKGVADYISKGDIFQLFKKVSSYIRKNRYSN
ncbi:response regulator [Thermodesulfovibrio sp.]|jgi:CheY-like chemotaxis protein|uniref:response regulator n=1 Tax=Thermodesulfovibrio TaxID=28261 RepID=UPI002623864E|nr:response regulator [Thermodesulfovibrio sp.]